MYEPNLLAWQWSLYSRNHRNRTNLLIHILTVPVFAVGFADLFLALVPGVRLWALAGPVLMVFAMALQGRGHKLESEAPVPFRGPVDVLTRILAEQLFTYPRYVLTGGFAKAWRESASG